MPSVVRPWPFARWIQREALPVSGSWSTYCRKHDSETVESEWGEEPIVQVIDGKGILHTMHDCEYIHGKLGTDD